MMILKFRIGATLFDGSRKVILTFWPLIAVVTVSCYPGRPAA